MVGSLIILSCITLANMRRGVLLHKLILLELVMGYWQVSQLHKGIYCVLTLAGLLHSVQPTYLRLVALCCRHSSQWLLDSA